MYDMYHHDCNTDHTENPPVPDCICSQSSIVAVGSYNHHLFEQDIIKSHGNEKFIAM